MNIPNSLSVLRIFMVPAFIYYFFSDSGNSMTISFIIVLLAGFTDVLDGIIARKFNLITKIGIVLDPLADKMMLMTVLVSMTVKDMLPIWIMVIVALKELTMILGALMLHNKHEIVMPANVYGKAATLSFYVAILAVAFHFKYYMLFMGIFVILTFLALIIYSNNVRKIKKEIKIENGNNDIRSVENGVYKGDNKFKYRGRNEELKKRRI